jgi:glycosyltransferase involved in cell wall biosynthesis
VIEAISKIPVSLFFPEAPQVKVGRLAHFARVYREFEPDIVFGHSTLPALYGRLALPILGPRPRFVSVLHGEDDYVDPRLRTFERLIRRRTDRVIAVGVKAAENYRERFGGSVPLLIIPNGIDLGLMQRARSDRTEHRKRLSLRLDEKLVLQVGRLLPLKQQQLSLRAMLPLLQVDASIHLWFAGLIEDENYANGLRGAIEETGLSGRVVILGSRDDVPALLASADLFLMPSVQEAQGIAMLEALASGVPVVASDIPSFRFAGGLPCVTLISQPDADSLRASIATSIHQPRTTRDLRDYDISVTAARYLDCARTLLQGGG